MAKKMGLGRGLSAILPDVEEVVESVDQASEGAAPVPADAVAEIPVGEIDPNRNQPRKRFDDDALLALADSIRLLNDAAPTDKVLSIRSLEALQKVADGKATKLIIPSEIQNLTGLLAAAKETVTDAK